MRYFINIGFLVLLFSCQSKQEKVMKEWEQNHNQCEMVEIDRFELLNPYLAADSIKQLRGLYEEVRQERILRLTRERDSLVQAIAIENEEYFTIENETLKRYFKIALKRMDGRLKQIEQNLSIYENYPELTQLNQIMQMVNAYQKDSSQVLGYIYQVQFLGKQGMLPVQTFDKRYLFDTTQTYILVEIEN